MRSTADARLAAAVAAGDERAFEVLVERHHAAIVRLARCYVRSEAVAEEVAQDTWAAVVAGIGRFQGRSSLKTWLFSIAVNKARTRGEREACIVPFSALDAREDENSTGLSLEDRFTPDGRWSAPPSAWWDPVHRTESLELRAAVRRAFERLPERQRLVVALRDIEGLSSREVQGLLGLSAANQRVLLHRGRTALQSALEEVAAPLAGAA